MHSSSRSIGTRRVTLRDDGVRKNVRFRPGDSILNRYTVIEELGQGGMGVVYKCRDEVGRVDVAIKGLPPEVSHNDLEMEDILENYQLVRTLRHPNIVGVTSLEREQFVRGNGTITLPDTPGDYYLVMDFAAGENLEWWRKHNRNADFKVKIAILRQVTDALDYAHECGVMHRDIKPENIMVDSGGHVSVLDFGLAERIRTSFSRVSMAVTSRSGTPGYKSPEQWKAQPQGAAADLYALGVVAYVLFAGHLPFDSDDMEILKYAVLHDPVPPIHGVAAHVNTALKRALAKKPEDRFGSCSEFIDALEGKTHRPFPTPWKLIVGGVCVAMLIGIGAWWLSHEGPAARPEPPESRPVSSTPPQPTPDPTNQLSVTNILSVSEVSVAPSIATNATITPKPSSDTDTELQIEKERQYQEEQERQRLENELARLNAEKVRLRNEIAMRFRSATNLYNRIAEYRMQPEGFHLHIEKVDSLWERVSSIASSDNATPEQLTNTLTSISNAVAGIQNEARWLEENRKTRDEILTVRKAADGLCDRFAGLKGKHWQTLQSYIDGTNSLAVGSNRLFNGELNSALECMASATNRLQTAYWDELKFIAAEKNRAVAEEKERERLDREEAERIAREKEQDRIAYEKCLEKITSFRKDATNEYAKIEVHKTDSEGLMSYLESADAVWTELNADSTPIDTVSAERTLRTITSDYDRLTQIVSSLEENVKIRDAIRDYRNLASDAIKKLESDFGSCKSKWSRRADFVDATNRYEHALIRFTSGRFTLLEGEFLSVRDVMNKIYGICMIDVAPQGFVPTKKETLKAGDLGVVRLQNNVAMSFRWCPPGIFRMGSPVSEQGRYPNESLRRETKIEPGFWMAETEITALQWATIMGQYESDEHLPKVNITWADCKTFVQKLNKISEDKMWGLTFSLPSEERWEYACRAGTDTPYWWGSDFDASKANGNKCDGKRHVADSATANEWSLSDMSGNVWEWCDTTDGERALMRGGAYDSDQRQCRSGKRQFAPKSFKAPNVGFRVIAILNRKDDSYGQ